jgi:hypothetical protein
VTNVAYAGASIDGDEIPSRLIQLFSSYEAIFYAVFRTQAKRVLLDRYSEVEQPLWPEIYHATGAVIDGKIKRLEDNIFTLRNVGLAPHPQKMDNFGQWVVFDFANFLISYQKFRDRVTEWAHDCGGLRIDHIGLRRAIDMAFMIYIGREFDPIFWIGEYLANSIVDEEEKNRLRLRLEAEFRVGKSDDTYMVNLDKRSPTAKKEALKFLVTSFLGQGSFRIFQKLRDSLLLRQNNLMSSKAVLHDEIEINPSLKAKFSENQWGLLRKIHFSI